MPAPPSGSWGAETVYTRHIQYPDRPNMEVRIQSRTPNLDRWSSLWTRRIVAQAVRYISGSAVEPEELDAPARPFDLVADQGVARLQLSLLEGIDPEGFQIVDEINVLDVLTQLALEKEARSLNMQVWLGGTYVAVAKLDFVVPFEQDQSMTAVGNETGILSLPVAGNGTIRAGTDVRIE
ncbi:MAG: hypothetical protein Q9174_007434 [Haloplaca sp. 1 TL-2023]